jgi:hypothetical protein
MLSHSSVLAVPMPHKHNADHRHHIPKMSFKPERVNDFDTAGVGI